MVDTAQLVAEVKTKGVKKATDQLDKFGKEARQADKASDKFKKGATAAFSAVKVGAVAITGAAAALTALTIKVAAAQKEWQTLANIAGSSVDDFKATAFAAEQVGISAEKLADISKDTKEKLGEFVATGGGGFKDFFEQVAPQVGITAAELQKLSGPEVLQKVTNALNQANVPLAQQSFFLESIASDTTNLIPLLANEGEELNRLTSRYNELNDALSITSSEQSALKGLSEDFDLLTKTGSNAIVFLTAQFAPELKAFLTFVTNEVPKATQEIFAFFDAFRDTENRQSIQGLEDEIQGLLAEISTLQQGINNGDFARNNLTDFIFEISETQAANKIKILRKEVEKLIAQRDSVLSNQPSAPAIIGDAPAASSGGFTGSVAESDEAKREKELIDYRFQLAQDFNNKQDELNLEYINGIDERRNAELASQQEILSATSSLFGSLSQLQAVFGKDSGAAFKVLFAAQQGFNIASAIASITTAAAQSAADPSAVTPAQKFANYGALISSIVPTIASIKGAGDFANGGVIGGGSFAGDNITANVNSGEMILNRGQQKNLFDIANGGGGRGANVTVINNAPGAIAREETLSSGEVRIIVEQELSSQVLRPNSQFNKNLDKTRKVSRQL